VGAVAGGDSGDRVFDGYQIMNNVFIFTFLLAGTLVVPAQVTYLTNQHMDFRLQYHPTAEGSNRLDMILDISSGIRGTNTEVYIVGQTNAKATIPGNVNFAFLGTPGAPVWILPQSLNINLPYIGISAADGLYPTDIPAGVFESEMALELVSVEGPGNFFVWSVSGAGQPPNVKMITTNGVIPAPYNAATITVNNHDHNNWAFSTNGLYRVTFRARGQFLGDTTNTLGRDVAWSFQILPLRPWENWISTNWPPATAGSTNGPAADPDGDGILNALEYALGLNPHTVSTTGLPTFSWVTDGGETYGALTFTRVKAATDIDYLPSVRSELGNLDWSLLTNVVSVIDAGDKEIVTVRDFSPASENNARFYQFRAKLNYP
jgi:surface-anchored protein